MVTKELSEAAVEINYILSRTNQEILNKIPIKFIKFFSEIESKSYKFEFDNTKSIKQQNLKPLTRGIIALIYSDYICTSEEREEYLKKSRQYFIKQEEEKKEKYKTEDLFLNRNKKELDNNAKKQTEIIVYKNNILKSILNKFKKILFNK